MATYTDQLVVYSGGSIKKIASSDHLVFTDGTELHLGDDADLKLYHDGTDSYLTNATGELKIATITSGIAVTIGHTTSEVTIGDNLTVSGDLTVNGTTTTVNSTTVQIDDLNLQLADGTAAAAAVDGGGITLATSGDDFTWQYNHGSTAWKSSIDIDAASGKAYKINGVSVLNATTLGSSVTSSSLTSVGSLAGLTIAGSNDLTITTHDGTNGLILGSTLVTSSAAELNILDAGTAGSSVGLADGDSFIIGDASATTANTTTKVLLSDLKTYINASAAGSIAADDIASGDDAVTIETSSGSVNIKDFGQGSTQLQILASNSTDAFEAGHVVSLEAGASGGLKLADKDDSTVVVGVAIEASSTDSRGHGEGGTPAAANIDVVTLWGSKVNVKISSGTPGLGVPVYLGDNGVALAGTAQVPTSGTVYRLGFTAEDASGGSAVTDVDIIWMPQFIADLG